MIEFRLNQYKLITEFYFIKWPKSSLLENGHLIIKLLIFNKKS